MIRYGMVVLISLMSLVGMQALVKPDPAMILGRSLEAHGGWKAFEALPVLSFTGDFTTTKDAATINGHITRIMNNSGCERLEYRSSAGTSQQGTNLEVQWEKSNDGLLIIHKSPADITRMHIHKLIATYQHIYPDTDIFTLRYKGIKDCNGGICHIILVTNNLNDDAVTYFVDKESFLIRGMKQRDSGNIVTCTFDDYAPCFGFLFPMKVKTVTQPGDQSISWDFHDVSAMPADITLFSPPEQHSGGKTP